MKPHATFCTALLIKVKVTVSAKITALDIQGKYKNLLLI